MKLNKWLYGAAALAMLAACSDNDVVPGGDNPNNEFSYAEGESYLGISLELPAEPSTRADDDYKFDNGPQGNDQFDDGESEEYNVKNVALLLFVGQNEDDAQFIGAYTLNPDEAFDQPNKDNITVSLQKTAKLPSKPIINAADNLYGLAIVNYNTNHFVLGNTNSTIGNLTIRAMTTVGETTETNIDLVRKTPAETNDEGVVTKPAVAGTTFSAIRGYITDCAFLNQGKDVTDLESIFMTNAPLSNVAGTTATSMTAPTIHTLATLDKDCFKQTQSDAIKSPAGCIFVERAVAKITCSNFIKQVEVKYTNVTNAETGAANFTEEDALIPILGVKWRIDNEEKRSYIVRNTSEITGTVWQYSTPNFANQTRFRFIGNAAMNDHAYDNITTGDGHGFYRTYWCNDPAYNIPKEYNDQSVLPFAAFGGSQTTKYYSNTPLYPHENTFTVPNQTYQNTTRVVFEVTYGTPTKKNGSALPGATDGIYSIRDYNKSFYLQSGAQNLLKRNVLASSELHDLISELVKDNLINPDGTFSLNYNESSFSWGFDAAKATDAEAQSTNGEDGKPLPTKYDGLDIKIGDYIVTSLTFGTEFASNLDTSKIKTKKKADGTEETAEEALTRRLKEIRLNASAETHISKYQAGTTTGSTKAYYAVYIQHFGDTYCPLPTKVENSVTVDDWEGKTTSKVYESNNAQKYLGRYGMVRNNWYDLSVDKIIHLGSATVPDGNVDTSDDNKEDEWYLSARIHILSWAKRTQHTTL